MILSIICPWKIKREQNNINKDNEKNKFKLKQNNQTENEENKNSENQKKYAEGVKGDNIKNKKENDFKKCRNAIYEKEVVRNKEREQIEDNKNEKNEFDISMKDAWLFFVKTNQKN